MAATNQSEVEMRLVDYHPFTWDNPDLLDRYYNDLGYSTGQIAEEVFDGEVSRETIRKRLHEYDLMPDDHEPRPNSSDPHKNRKMLIAIGQQQDDSIPEGDDSYKKYYNRTEGENDAA